MKLIVTVLFVIIFAGRSVAEPIKVMLVTGGHAYDTLQFFQMFDELEGIDYEHFEQPEANREIANGKAEDFDVLVFYDMWQNIGMEERLAYINLTQKGKPMLFLHHSLVSYQNWPEFEKIVGGKYIEAGKNTDEESVSNYEHDVWVYCNVENYTPVTNGFQELRFFDEVYGNVRISDDIKPLLSTKHPKSMKYVAWEHKYKNSAILYIQPGHDKRTYIEKDYKKLLLQSIRYLVRK